MTEIQVWILLGLLGLILVMVIHIATNLNRMCDHLFGFSTPPVEFERLASRKGSITDNQAIISKQIDTVSEQIFEIRKSDEIPKLLRQIRDFVRGVTPEEFMPK